MRADAIKSRDSSSGQVKGRKDSSLVDSTHVSNKNSTIKFLPNTEGNKKVTKLPDKSPPLFSKVMQGISPVLTQTNRKKSCMADQLNESYSK